MYNRTKLRSPIGLSAAGLLLAAIVVVLLYFGSTFRTVELLSAPEIRDNSSKIIDFPSVLPAPNVPAVEPPCSNMYVADRRIMANITIEALNEYFDRKGIYPAFLFGGGERIYPNLGSSGQPSKYSYEGIENPDPLIAEGILDSYPLVWPIPMTYYTGDMQDVYDSRLRFYWRCMYSTPGDQLIVGDPGPRLYEAEVISRKTV
jgi:hypothetical protein